MTQLMIPTFASIVREAIQDDDESHLDESETGIDVGWMIPPNTFAQDLFEYHHSTVQNRFDCLISAAKDPRIDLGKNPHRIADNAKQRRPEMESNRVELARVVKQTLQVFTIGGTGFPMTRLADVRDAMAHPVDVLVQSHKLQRLTREPPAREQILAAISYPLMANGTVLIDHRIDDVGYGGVAPETAQILAALSHVDIQDLSQGFHSLAYQTIPTEGASQAELSQQIQRRARSMSVWFTPQYWAPWLEEPQAPPTRGQLDVIAIIPEGYDRIQGDNFPMRPIQASVENAHVLAIRPLSRSWIEENLQHQGVEWLEQKIREGDNRIATVWAGMAEEYGIQDPVAEWERFRRKHLEEHLDNTYSGDHDDTDDSDPDDHADRS